jgi:hypothetical protein
MRGDMTDMSCSRPCIPVHGRLLSLASCLPETPQAESSEYDIRGLFFASLVPSPLPLNRVELPVMAAQRSCIVYIGQILARSFCCGSEFAMRATNDDLHGNAPDDAEVALLLIDVIDDLEFDGGEVLLTQALPMAAPIAVLKRRAQQAGIPVVYVNDNFGRWQSDFAKLLAHCLRNGVLGQPLAEQLPP